MGVSDYAVWKRSKELVNLSNKWDRVWLGEFVTKRTPESLTLPSYILVLSHPTCLYLARGHFYTSVQLFCLCLSLSGTKSLTAPQNAEGWTSFNYTVEYVYALLHKLHLYRLWPIKPKISHPSLEGCDLVPMRKSRNLISVFPKVVLDTLEEGSQKFRPCLSYGRYNLVSMECFFIRGLKGVEDHFHPSFSCHTWVSGC
jgi:hypothetical protein